MIIETKSLVSFSKAEGYFRAQNQGTSAIVPYCRNRQLLQKLNALAVIYLCRSLICRAS